MHSSEFAALIAEPEGRALAPALLLLDNPADVSQEPIRVQLAATVLNTTYILNREKLYSVHPSVEVAFNLP